jgi:hypothetical protein
MKTPTCKGCKGTGKVKFEGEFISQPVEMTCWICGGFCFKGMNRDQIAWYLLQRKTFEKLKAASLRAGEPSDVLAYSALKRCIDTACSRLKIALQAIPRSRSTFHGISDQELFLKTELKEYERRLEAIPLAAAAL